VEKERLRNVESKELNRQMKDIIAMEGSPGGRKRVVRLGR
jgi:hypothetical protein